MQQLKDKEILVQLALGTFDNRLLYLLVQETNNPQILTAVAKTFVKLDTGTVYSTTSVLNSTIIDADDITSAFMNNKQTHPPLVKSYVMVARQIKGLKYQERQLINKLSSDWTQYNASTKNRLTKEFEKIHQQLFDN